MAALDWVAALVLFLLLPVPLFWLLVHPLAGFWRRRSPRAAYLTAWPTAWILGTTVLVGFRERLFASRNAPLWAIFAGLTLILAEVAMVLRVVREFGRDRLVGKKELAGSRELVTTGIYARVRHPSYTGMMGAMLGVCLLAGTLALWLVAFCWWLLMLAAIHFEERELRARFGQAYVEYCRRVPRFLPFRLWPEEE